MRSLYDALMCSSVRSPKRSVARMSSQVRPAAPFIVIPSAIDADSPERKTLGPVSVASTVRNRSIENALEAEMTASSDPVRARGSSSMTAGASSASGPVGSPHAATERKTSRAGSAAGRRAFITPERSLPRLDIRGLSSLGPDLLQVSTTPICSSIASSSKISNSSTTLPCSKRDRMWPWISIFFPVAGMSPSGPSWVPATFQ